MAQAICKTISGAEEKLDIWREVLKEHSQEARAHEGIGEDYWEIGSLEEDLERRADYLEKATEHLNMSYELNPDNVGVLIDIGWCHQLREDYEAEEQAYQILLDLVPAPPVHLQKKALARLCGIRYLECGHPRSFAAWIRNGGTPLH